jgi:arylformamidase
VRVIDISMELREGMAVYPGDGPVRLENLSSLGKGDPYELTYLHMGAHAGTHLDAPAHFLAGGMGVEGIPLQELIGPCRVCRLDEGVRSIGPACLEKRVVTPARRLLLRTGNSLLHDRDDFQADHAYLTGEGAAWLRDNGVRLVGFDYLSVERYGAEKAEAHLELLRAGIPILEGLDLSGVEEGEYWLIALPLRLLGAEGAPVRAVLLQEERGLFAGSAETEEGGF